AGCWRSSCAAPSSPAGRTSCTSRSTCTGSRWTSRCRPRRPDAAGTRSRTRIWCRRGTSTSRARSLRWSTRARSAWEAGRSSCSWRGRRRGEGDMTDVSTNTDAPPTAERYGPGTVAVVVLALLAVAAAITYLGPILKPFLVAVFLFYATRFAAGVLSRRGFPPWLAYLTLFVASVVVGTAVVLFAYREAHALRADLAPYEGRVLGVVGERVAGLKGSVAEWLTSSSREVFAYMFEAGMGAVELILMTFFYLLFLIISARKFPARVMRAFPGPRGQRILAVGDRIGDGM